MKYLKNTLCIMLAAVIAFSALGMSVMAVEETLPENATYVSGDADGNGIVNSADALTILNYVIGNVDIPDVVRRTAADVNADGKINSTDSLYILNFKVGNLTASDPIKGAFPRENYKIKKLAGNMMIDEYTGCVIDAKGVGLVGYAYDMNAGVFYATGEGFQREFGYAEIYDRVAVVGTMPLDTTRVFFNYEGKDWMVQFWKGFYGLVFAGCEIGIYNRPEGMSDELTAYNVVTLDYYQDFTIESFYNNSDKSTLFHKAEPDFTRSTRTWWFTAFEPSINVSPATNIPKMKFKCTMTFNDLGLMKAFVGGMKNVDNIFANYTGKARSFYFVEGQNLRVDESKKQVWFEWQ